MAGGVGIGCYAGREVLGGVVLLAVSHDVENKVILNDKEKMSIKEVVEHLFVIITPFTGKRYGMHSQEKKTLC